MKIFLICFDSTEYTKKVLDCLKKEGLLGSESVIVSSSYDMAIETSKDLARFLGTPVEFYDELRIEYPEYIQNDQKVAGIILERQQFHQKNIIAIVHHEHTFSLPMVLASWQRGIVPASKNKIIKIDFVGKTINLLPLKVA